MNLILITITAYRCMIGTYLYVSSIVDHVLFMYDSYPFYFYSFSKLPIPDPLILS